MGAQRVEQRDVRVEVAEFERPAVDGEPHVRNARTARLVRHRQAAAVSCHDGAACKQQMDRIAAR